MGTECSQNQKKKGRVDVRGLLAMKNKKINRNILVKAGLVLVACLFIMSGAVYHLMKFSVQKETAQAQYTAEAATRRVEAQLNKYLVVTDVLKKLIKNGYEISGEDFGTLSGFMMDNDGVIEAIEYARDGVVSAAYPLEGNEEAIGLNLLENPERKKEATLAMTSGQYTIAGPFELAQGGTGTLLLDPIYTIDEGGEEQFWGFSLLVLNWDAFLEEVHLNKMEYSGYYYQLWRRNFSTGEKVIIAQCEEKEMSKALEVVCEVPNDTWYFEIMPKEGWVTSSERVISILCIIVVSFLITFIYWQYAVRHYQEKIYKKELERAATEAKAANEAKTRFLFNMSHDIRTPMNAILGFASMAEENIADTEKVQSSLEKVKIAGKELLSLINEILNISHIESGTMKKIMETADLYEFCRTMELLFEQSMAAKGISFKIATDIRESCVICDIQHMREICINLLSNAQKFTPEGGSVIFAVVQKEEVRENVFAYEIRIEDTGIGMSEEFQKIQFELFEREESNEVSKIEGTGLGLPIVKRLMDLLDGRIECVSEKGKGTAYTLTFQLETDEQHCDAEPSTSDKPEKNTGNFAGKHVLLVEDNELNREIALYLLEDMKLRVDIAEDGVIAVEKVKVSAKDRYDLILMDVQMPNMNGYEATVAIRHLEDRTLAETPIIAMTANAFEEDKRAALEAGMNGHLAKPINVNEMMRAIRELL